MKAKKVLRTARIAVYFTDDELAMLNKSLAKSKLTRPEELRKRLFAKEKS